MSFSITFSLSNKHFFNKTVKINNIKSLKSPSKNSPTNQNHLNFQDNYSTFSDEETHSHNNNNNERPFSIETIAKAIKGENLISALRYKNKDPLILKMKNKKNMCGPLRNSMKILRKPIVDRSDNEVFSVKTMPLKMFVRNHFSQKSRKNDLKPIDSLLMNQNNSGLNIYDNNDIFNRTTLITHSLLENSIKNIFNKTNKISVCSFYNQKPGFESLKLNFKPIKDLEKMNKIYNIKLDLKKYEERKEKHLNKILSMMNLYEKLACSHTKPAKNIVKSRSENDLNVKNNIKKTHENSNENDDGDDIKVHKNVYDSNIISDRSGMNNINHLTNDNSMMFLTKLSSINNVKESKDSRNVEFEDAAINNKTNLNDINKGKKDSEIVEKTVKSSQENKSQNCDYKDFILLQEAKNEYNISERMRDPNRYINVYNDINRMIIENNRKVYIDCVRSKVERMLDVSKIIRNKQILN